VLLETVREHIEALRALGETARVNIEAVMLLVDAGRVLVDCRVHEGQVQAVSVIVEAVRMHEDTLRVII
jgi:hypothetical protein